MAHVPTYVGKGAFQSGTGALTVPVPSGYRSNDLLLLAVESENQTINTPTGWTQAPSSPQGTGTAAAAGSVRLGLFYKIATGAEASVSVADTGDHTTGIMIAVRGVDPADPIHKNAGSVDSSATSTITFPSVTTTQENTLIAMFAGLDKDLADSDTVTGSFTNANLSSITERHDQTVASADGGGILIVTGVKATAGSTGTTTATADSSTTHAYVTLALRSRSETLVKPRGQYQADQETPVGEGGAYLAGATDGIYLQADISPVFELDDGITSKAEIETVSTSFNGAATITNPTFIADSSNTTINVRGGALVYDTKNDRYIFFGGYNGTTRFNTVWARDCSKPAQPWRKLAPTGTPPTAKNLAAASYYRGNKTTGGADTAIMIVWGGNTGSDTNEMHILDVTTPGSEVWTVVSQTSAPSARSYITGHTVTVPVSGDSSQCHFYLFGGWATSRENGLHRCTIDLDSLGSTTWTTLKANGTGGNPTVRSGAITGYKASTGKIYIYGGYSGSAMLTDFWSYDIAGDAFTQETVSGTAPSGTELGAGGYDSVNNRFWYTAGWTTSGTQNTSKNFIGYISDVGGSEAYNEVRAQDDDNQAYASLSSPAFCVDTKRNWLVLYGMMTFDSTERYSYVIDLDDGVTSNKPVYGLNEGDWMTIHDAQASVYNPDRNEWLTINGFAHMGDEVTIATGTHVNNVWAYNPITNEWRYALKGDLGMVHTEGSTAVYDTRRKRIVVFGGLTGVSETHNEVWTLTADSNGMYKWEKLTPTGTPPVSRWLCHGMYDPINDRALFVWGGDKTGPLDQVWELSFSSSAQGAWTQRTPSSGTWTAVTGAGFSHKQYQDNFLDPTANPFWADDWGGTHTTTGLGYCNVALDTTANYYGMSTAQTLDLTGGFVQTALVDEPLDTYTSLEVELKVSQDSDDYVTMALIVNVSNVLELHAYDVNAGTPTSLASVTYNHSTMRHWRIRESSGTTYWEYSGDGLSWTALHSVANPITLTNVWSDIDAGYWQAEAAGQDIKFEYFRYYSPVLYIAGGATNASLSTVSSQLRLINAATTSTTVVSQTNTSPVARRTPALAWDPINNRLIWFAGFNGTNSINTLQYWNAGSPGAWTTATVTPSPDARRSLGYMFLNGTLVISHGRSDSSPWYKDTWALSPNYGTPNSSVWTNKNPRVYQPHYFFFDPNTSGQYHWQLWATEDSVDSTKQSFPYASFAGTYYFDASDAAISDPGANWTGDASAFDGFPWTIASPTNAEGSTSSNFLHGQGTNAPASGGTISYVRARLYGEYNGSESQGTGTIYTDGLGESLGVVQVDAGAGSFTGYGSWTTLSTPTGGWTWAKIQNLEVKLYKPGPIGAQGVGQVDFEVYTQNADTTGAIEYISSAATEGTTISMPTHQTGDLLVMVAGRDDSTTAPSVPGGWSQPSSPTNTGTSTAMTVAYKFAASSSETSGTWTNAGALAAHVLRGANTTTPLIKHSGNNGTGTTVDYAGATMTWPGESWGLRSAIHSSTNTALNTVPSGYTNRANNSTPSVMEIATHDTNGAASSIVFGSTSVGGTSGNWVTQSIEVQRQNTNAETDFELGGASTYTVTHTTDALKRKTLTSTHTTDANKKVSGTTLTHTTDALAHVTFTKTHTTDSFLSKPLPTIVDFNGDFEDYPTVNSAATDTAGRWIDGTQAGSTTRTWYWAIPTAGISGTGVANAQFDTSVKRNGAASMRLNTVSNTIAIASFRTNSPTTGSLPLETFPILPNQLYRVEGYLKTDSVATNGAFIDFRQFGSDATNLATTSTNKLSGTNDWTYVSATFTSNAAAAWGTLLIRNQTTSAASVWADDVQVRAVFTTTHTTDALKRKATTITHTTDSNKKKPDNVITHTTDSNKKKPDIIVSHTTDSLKRKQFTLSHFTDSNKKNTSTLSHTSDANKKKTTTITHTTNALLREVDTLTHSTDSNKRKQSVVVHTTDSNKKKTLSASHTADSYLRAVVHAKLTQKIEMNRTPSNTSGTANTYIEIPYIATRLNSDDFDGVVNYYFEAVFRNSGTSGQTAYVELWNKTDGVSVSGSELSILGPSPNGFPKRLRSAAIALSGDKIYTIRVKHSNTTSNTVVAAARLIVVQTGDITKTQIHHELGVESSTSSTSNSNRLTGVGKFLYEASKYDGTVTIRHDAVLRTTASNTTTSGIYDETAGSVVSGSEVNKTNDTNPTLLSSGNITLTDGNIYAPTSYVSAGSAVGFNSNKLVFTITGGFTKYLAYVAQDSSVSGHANSTSLYPDYNVFVDYIQNWDDTDFAGANVKTAYEANISINNSAQTVYSSLQEYDYDNVTVSTVQGSVVSNTGTTDITRVRSGFFSPMPGSDVVVGTSASSGTNAARTYNAYLIVEVDQFNEITNTLSHTTDSNLRPAVATITQTHTTDANKRKATALIHSTDSNKKKSNTIVHTTDTFIVSLLSSGPNSPGTGANDSAVGTIVWNNPGNILTSNNSSADANDLNPGITNYLKATNFGFSIPSNATVRGIKVDVERRASGNGVNFVQDERVSIVKSNGTVGSTNKGDTVTKWPTSDTYVSYGGDDDLWGETWAYSDINDVDFGVVLSAELTQDTTVTAFVDHIRITVYYTTPTPSFPVTHNTDSLKRKASTLTHTTDSLKRASVLINHTSDANKRKALVVVHTTDSNKKKATTVNHTTDSYLITQTLTYGSGFFMVL